MSNDEKDDPTTGDEAVGYGRPPISTRFKKGQSGNPRGRPKGSLNVASALRKAMREKVVISEHGKRKTITKLEASSKQLVNQAASGKSPALRYLFELAQQIEKREDQSPDSCASLSEIDQEVIQGLLSRFQPQEPGSVSEKKPEVDLNDDERR